VGPGARNLLVLSTRSTSPGQRFRIENWTPLLEDAGVHVTGQPFATPQLDEVVNREGERLRKIVRSSVATATYPFRLPKLSDYDGLLIYRAAVPTGIPLLERRLARADVPIALDIDDPIFFRAPVSGNPFSRFAQDRKWRRLCDAAAITICINQRIADYLEPYTHEVVVLPNLIDLRRYPEKSRSTDGPVVLGYHGSPTTTPYLLEIDDPLERAGAQTAFELCVVGGRSPVRGHSYRVVERAWSAAEEIPLLHSLDVGLAPAAPDEWAPFKSFVKILVYMSAGIPVIATPTGSAPDVIDDGVNGFLAATPEEWVERISALVSDADLRERMGRAARRTIEAEYSLEARAGEVVEVFRRLLADR
jgi:L-malate glycosyltransferase